jgi:acetyltransferase-like isoleucine patch superfamily enzyme
MTRDPITRSIQAAAVAKSIVWLRLHGVEYGHRPCFRRRAPTIVREGRMVLGHRLYSHGLRFRSRLCAYRGATLEIGDDVRLNGGVMLDAHARITIGNGCRLAELVSLIDSQQHPSGMHDEVRTAPIVLGENVWLGRLVTVLPGVTIGSHTVVAAGSVVTHDLPDRAIARGNPAEVVRPLEAAAGWHRP